MKVSAMCDDVWIYGYLDLFVHNNNVSLSPSISPPSHSPELTWLTWVNLTIINFMAVDLGNPG